MLLGSGAHDKQIVQISKDEVQTTRYLLDEALEGFCRVPQPKRYAHILEASESCCDGGFWVVGNSTGI